MEITVNGKKILIVTEYFYPEEFKINDIALSWKYKGYDVDVLTLVPSYPLGQVFDGYKNSMLSKDLYKGINIYRIRAVTGYNGSLFKKLLKYINFVVFGSILGIFIGKKYDYIFGNNVGALTDMVPAVVVKKIYKKPLMFWVQDVWPDSVYAYGFQKTKLLSVCLNIFVNAIYRQATAIAISGKGFESKLRPYIKNNLKFHYLPNWADDLKTESDVVSLGDDARIQFTFAGNIGCFQNLENIINAFSLLPFEHKKKSQLNIIGDGSYLEYLKGLSANNQCIVFHGKKPRKDMGKYYKASDCLIVSLIDEPIFSVTVPAKVQTYIAAKKPILAIINGDTADIVIDNGLGLYADSSDIKSIKKSFIDFIDLSEQKKEEFIAHSEKLLKEDFNKERIINKLTSVLIGQ